MATVPSNKGFSRNYRVKCALLKTPTLSFLSLFSISYFIYALSMDVILALGKLLNIRLWLFVSLLLASSSFGGTFNFHVLALRKVLRSFFRNLNVRICL